MPEIDSPRRAEQRHAAVEALWAELEEESADD